MNPEQEAQIQKVKTKDDLIMEAMLPYAQQVAPKFNNKTDVQIVHETRNTSIVFMLLPEWAPTYPPYNLARLSAVTKAAGYKTHVFDVNVAGYKLSRDWDIGWDPWHYVYMTRWFAPVYQEELEPHLLPLLNEYLEKVVALNPTCVGFTLYDCNKEPVKWMNRELKKRLPNLISILGGPICHRTNPMVGEGQWGDGRHDFDYIVMGEGEELILEVLEDIEKNGKPNEFKHVVQQFSQRINLDSLPLPDYSHFNFNDYQMPNGATTELSRGCTAKCVFCDETHFWKYRNREASSLMKELKYLYHNGINYIWFLDSLVNGNLKELRNFTQSVKESGMNMRWSGYMRCDGRMDLDFYRDMKESGCMTICYGVESGSNKVLADMNKGITREEIEQNFKDADTVGIDGVMMMIPGFPTETPQELYETFTTLWRIRNCRIDYIAAGQIALAISEESIIGHMREDYGVLLHSYGHNWITRNFDNSKAHRLIRMKIFNIFLNNLVNKRNKDFSNRKTIDNHYKLTFENPEIQNEIEHEVFDFNIIKANTGNNHGDTIVNEVWPLIRLLWRTRGAFKLELTFEEEEDHKEFSKYLGCPLNAKIFFEIDSTGKWKADMKFDFQQPPDYWHHNSFANSNSNAHKRIMTWAKKSKFPKKTLEEGYADFTQNYKDLDLSFNYHYQGEGQW